MRRGPVVGRRFEMVVTSFFDESPEGDRSPIPKPGYSIAQLLKRFDGDEGYITDPDGRQHPLSLKQWAARDPHRTRVRIAFLSPPAQEEPKTA